MEYPKANNCLTLVHQFYNNQRRHNGLDKRVQGKFLKGSFLASKMDSFLETGLGASPVRGPGCQFQCWSV